MKTGQEYIESLKKQKKVIYYNGEKIDDYTSHPAFVPHINAAAVIYDMAWDPQYEDLAVTTSHLTGQKINRFTHIHHSPDDLIKKVKLLRAAGQRTGTCFQRCAGWDALHATYIVTFGIDKKQGTEYHRRFLKFLERVQTEDLMCAAGVTDPKGDRRLRPHEQQSKDLFLHVVETTPEGIIISGAKAHQTGAINSHEIIVFPTQAMTEEDKEFAVICSVPADAPGITYVFGRQTNDGRRLEKDLTDTGNILYGSVGGEALIIFKDVFVPWQNVYMNGEYEFTGKGVELFAVTHRQNYGACKGGVMDVLIGATSLITKYNGVDKASHVKDKLVEMVHLNETSFGSSLGAGVESSLTPSGAYVANPLLANTVKQNITRNIYEICRISQDLAGGILATLPANSDFEHPEIGPILLQLFKGVNEIATEDRIRILRLIENMTCGTALVEAMHGAGSPQAQRVGMLRQANLASKENLAKRLCSIDES